MKLVRPDKLYELAKNILTAGGTDGRNADCIAEHLISANLNGVDTHGVWHLPGYVALLKSGEVLGTVWPEIVKETPTSALVSGNWGFGHVTAKYAIELAIEKARSQNVAVVSSVQMHHTGRLGFYTEKAAEEKMVSLLWSGGYGEIKPAATPYGGKERIFHTNPIAIGLPAKDGYAVNVDFATSVTSGVNVVNARNRGERMKPGSIVDKDGNPTTDPEDFFKGGGHTPFGGHKGWGLMIASEFLSQVFIGTQKFADKNYGGDVCRYQGLTMLVFKSDLFQAFDEYSSRAEEVLKRVRSIRPAPGFQEVMVPGDKETKAKTRREQEGIPIPEDTWKSLVELSRSLGISDIEQQ